MTKQYGFYFDAGRCIQCRSCEIACKITNKVETSIKWREVVETWSGKFPDVKRTFFSRSCMHCEEPACMTVCSPGAIYKREEDGIVLVDSEKCNGCGDCIAACPWHIPQVGNNGKMQKCDYCTGFGEPPACAVSCPAEALFAGPVDELLKMAEAKNGHMMEGVSKPSVIIME